VTAVGSIKIDERRARGEVIGFVFRSHRNRGGDCGVFDEEGRNERAHHSHASAYAATCAVTIDPYLVEYGIGSSFSMACIGGRSADR
jgi:methyl coenzyme M reductase beta subunit